MISVSQAVQSLATARPSSTSVQLSRTALLAAAFPPSSSVSLSISTVAQELLLYTASGTLSTPSSKEADVSVQDTNTATVGESTSATVSSPVAPATAAPTVTGAPVAVTSTENAEATASLTPSAANDDLAASVFVDPAVEALADFTANPVHGNLATALLINAANFRTRQASPTPLVNAIDLPGPVSSLNAISVDVADLNEQSSGRQGMQTTFSSGTEAGEIDQSSDIGQLPT